MDAESARAFLLTLPYVVETGSATRRWGDKLVFRVGDQTVGGKMFAQFDFDESGQAMLSFAAGSEHFRDLLEVWNVFRRAELENLLCRAHALVYTKLPKRTQSTLQRAAKPREQKSGK
jgi:predicted DNA-binding protein (MmcQ/YjbR family)